MAIIRLTEPLGRKSLWIAVLSEFIGTLLLVALGVGIIYINFSHSEQNSQVAHSTKFILTSVGFGIVVGGIVFCLGFGFPHGSAHLNPAFTLGALVLDKVSVVRAVFFIVAQVLGGIAGGAILYGCFHTMRGSHFACTQLTGVEPLQGFGIEFLATFVLVLAIFGIIGVSERQRYGAVVVALGVAIVIAVLVIVSGPYTGASLNPARSLGPAILFGSKCWTHHWVYWAGPLSGGLLAGAITRILLYSEEETHVVRTEVHHEVHESRKLVTATTAA